MKTISFICQEYYHADKLFDRNDVSKNRDNCLLPWILLKEKLEKKGFIVHTDDLLDPKNAEYRVYLDNIDNETGIIKGSYLLLIESSIIQPKGWIKKHHEKFEKIFAWGYDEKDGTKYHRIFIPQAFPSARLGKSFDERKLACMISGNKESYNRQELYAERRKIIRWYEKFNPNSFDLYGRGWELGEAIIPGYIRKIIPILNKIFRRKYPSFKGSIESKHSLLENYKFCFCYENSQGFKGYITEKIFDPMFVGCIPIYIGAPDIIEHVPSDCFINPRKFRSMSDLNDFLMNMSEEEFRSYQERIKKFLGSDSLKKFTAEYFSNQLVEEFK